MNHARRVAELQALGWSVTWQRVQYAAPTTASSADGGYFYVIGVCRGFPQ